MVFHNGLAGDQLARDVLGYAHDPIDGGKDDNHTRHTPLSHHHCNPANLKEGQIFLYIAGCTSASAGLLRHFLRSTPSVHSPGREKQVCLSKFLSNAGKTCTFSRRDTSSRFPPYIPVPGRDASATFTGSCMQPRLRSS